MHEGIGRDELAGLAVDHVEETISVGLHVNRDLLSPDVEISKRHDHLANPS